MVLFTPPLGTHLTVDLPPASSSSTTSNRRVVIAFTASDPDNKVGPEDVVELWTNAPGHTGGRGEKEWRAVRFEPVEVEADAGGSRAEVEGQAEELGNISQKPTSSFSIPSRTISLTPPTSTSTTPHPSESNKANQRQATLLIPLPESSTTAQSLDFEYTFRILYPDGNIWWLGGMGVNGTVCLKVGEAGEGYEKKAGLGCEGRGGFALKVDQDR